MSNNTIGRDEIEKQLKSCRTMLMNRFSSDILSFSSMEREPVKELRNRSSMLVNFQFVNAGMSFLAIAMDTKDNGEVRLQFHFPVLETSVAEFKNQDSFTEIFSTTVIVDAFREIQRHYGGIIDAQDDEVTLTIDWKNHNPRRFGRLLSNAQRRFMILMTLWATALDSSDRSQGILSCFKKLKQELL